MQLHATSTVGHERDGDQVSVECEPCQRCAHANTTQAQAVSRPVHVQPPEPSGLEEEDCFARQGPIWPSRQAGRKKVRSWQAYQKRVLAQISNSIYKSFIASENWKQPKLLYMSQHFIKYN